MSYREHLAEFTAISVGALLFQEYGQIFEAEAREGIVQAIHAGDVPVRFRAVDGKGDLGVVTSADRGDGAVQYQALMEALTPHLINWADSSLDWPPLIGQADKIKSEAEVWASGITWVDVEYDERTYRIEVSRPAILKLLGVDGADVEPARAPSPKHDPPQDWYEQTCNWLAGPYYEKHKSDKPHPNRDEALAAAREKFPGWPITATVWRNDIWKNHAPAAWHKTGPRK